MQPFSSRSVATIAWLLLASFPFLGAAERVTSHHLRLNLVSEQSVIVPGQEFSVALHFALDPGWHLYWVNPGDSGEPPRVEWTLPAGFRAGAFEWPTPRRINDWQVVDYGYENELVLLTRVQAPPGADGTADLQANVKWAVCRDVCIADRAQLSLKLPVASKAEAAPPKVLFERTRANLPRVAPRAWKASAVSTKDSFVLTIRGGSTGIPPKAGVEPNFFPLEKQQIENAAPQKFSATGNTARFVLKKSEQLLKPVATLKGVVSFGPGQSFLIEAPVSERR